MGKAPEWNVHTQHRKHNAMLTPIQKAGFDIYEPTLAHTLKCLYDNATYDCTDPAAEYQKLYDSLGVKADAKQLYDAEVAQIKWDYQSRIEEQMPIEEIRKHICKENSLGVPIGLHPKKTADWILSERKFITLGDKTKEIYHFDKGVYVRGGETIILERIQELGGSLVSNHICKEILGHIQRKTFANREILESAPKNLICLQNGVLDIETGILRLHNPEVIFTQRINASYNPDATCPNILNFLSDTIQPDALPTLQEYCGYILYRGFIFKKAVILIGESDTGKTTFLRTLVKCIGQENTSGESLHKIISDKFSAVNLYGKLLNFYDDLSYSDIKDTGLFKILTGGGYISGEYKFGDRFQFMNYAKLLFATNKISKVEDSDDDAYYSRWILIFFNNQILEENKDPYLVEKCTTEQELSGFLNWCLDGLKRLLKQGRFSYNKSPEEIKTIMQRSSDPISAFVQDCVYEYIDSYFTKDLVYEVYSQYVNKNGGARVSKEKFGRDFQKYAKFTTSGQRDTTEKPKAHVWLNLAFKPKVTGFLSNSQVILVNTFDSLMTKNKLVKPVTDKNLLAFEEKTQAWQRCCYPIGKDAVCNKSPCNELDGLYFCQEHFARV